VLASGCDGHRGILTGQPWIQDEAGCLLPGDNGHMLDPR
jgi:hypothetical protein